MDEKLHRTTLRAEHISGQPGHALSDHLASDTGANANVRDQVSDDQRLAMGRAMVDGNLTAPKVVATPRCGWDTRPRRPHAGAVHDQEPSTLRDQLRPYSRRQAGELRPQLSSAPPRDAIEDLSQRLINVADAEMTALERQKAGTRDSERMRQLSSPLSWRFDDLRSPTKDSRFRDVWMIRPDVARCGASHGRPQMTNPRKMRGLEEYRYGDSNRDPCLTDLALEHGIDGAARDSV